MARPDARDRKRCSRHVKHRDMLNVPSWACWRHGRRSYGISGAGDNVGRMTYTNEGHVQWKADVATSILPMSVL